MWIENSKRGATEFTSTEVVLCIILGNIENLTPLKFPHLLVYILEPLERTNRHFVSLELSFVCPLFYSIRLSSTEYSILEWYAGIILWLCCLGSPYSLLRLCRVQVRQMLGPATFDYMLPGLNLPPSLGVFMQEVRGDGMWEGAGSLVKEVALQGGSEEYWQLQANPP